MSFRVLVLDLSDVIFCRCSITHLLYFVFITIILKTTTASMKLDYEAMTKMLDPRNFFCEVNDVILIDFGY